MDKYILITGWLWYIWSHCVVAFEQAWYKTVIIDNLSNSSLNSLIWIEKILGYKPDFFKTDLKNIIDLDKIFQKYNFELVVHFAWLKSVWESCKSPLDYHNNNIIWSIHLFELIQKFYVKNIIFSSSATVYKPLIEENRWFSENDLVWDCINPYWTTKFVLEQILKDLANYEWFKVMNLRYFNPIWAHKTWYIWEDSNWIPNNLLPYIMKVLSWELPYLNVFWDDYNTKDWTWVRDYIDVNDLIDGHLSAYNKITQKLKSDEWFFETYNLWTWKWVSVLDMIKTTEKVTQKKVLYKVVWRRAWDLAEVYCNALKAEQDLNWKAKISLEESLKNSYNFILNSWKWKRNWSF